MNVGERIKHERKRKKMSVDKLGELIGKDRATVYRYEKNEIENVPYTIISKIANALEVDESYLMGWGKPENIYEIKPDFVKIPIIGEIACGEPLLIHEQAVDYMWELSDGLPHGELFALITKGDSMEPTISDGSKVIVRQQNDVENGEIAAVLVNGDTEATLKRVKKQGNIIMLIPDNQKHEIIIVNENNPARIIGKVVRAVRDFI